MCKSFSKCLSLYLLETLSLENNPKIANELRLIKKQIKRLGYMDKKKYLTPLFSGACANIYVKLRKMFKNIELMSSPDE